MQGLASVIALSLLVPALALADPGKDKPTPDKPTPVKAITATFESLDRNADQRLSRSEAGYDRVLSEVFAATDADGDGFVSRREYATLATASNQLSTRVDSSKP